MDSRPPVPLAPDAAWERLLPHLRPLAAEETPRRAARGRVLARQLSATVDVPAADVSAMDGFAVAGPLPAGGLPVAGTIAAGEAPGRVLEPGSALRIMTGAPLPRGADRVLPVEISSLLAEPARVTFQSDLPAGANIRRRGEVHAADATILRAGETLTPGALALAATHGYAALPTHRAPRVALLVTGDEVVSADTAPRPGQLRDSHTDFLLAAGAGMGLAFEALGIAPDRSDVLREKIAAGMRADVLLLSGGVSMGEFDLVEGALAELGCETLFDAVAIQPGKPLVAARHAGGLVFGLPGNPASAMVGFWLFVHPALRRLLGFDDGFWHGALTGELTEPLPACAGKDRFWSAKVEARQGHLYVTPVPNHGSHDLAAFARGTGLVRARAGSAAAPAGAACEVLALGEWPLG